MNRRELLKVSLGMGGTAFLGKRFRAAPRDNLVPPLPADHAPLSYWCTWCTQGSDNPHDDDGTLRNLNERTLFEEPGWISYYYSKIRGDLNVVLDEGWDVPLGFRVPDDLWQLSSLELPQEKFPSYAGSPALRLRKLKEHVQRLGWAGLGFWVAADVPGDGRVDDKLLPDEKMTSYWEERLRWCGEAGIAYAKVDWGMRSGDVAFRKMLTRRARTLAPKLIVEHAAILRPVNEPKDGSGRFANWERGRARAERFLAFSDVVRGYDILYQMPTATMLDRIATLLQFSPAEWEGSGFLNSEDEVYLAAALGCSMGIMRHPCWRSNRDLKSNPVQYHRRIDEVVRAVRWQRIAPPVRVRDTRTTVDDTLLTDNYRFAPGQTWAEEVNGQNFTQSAPARVARNMPLPKVTAKGEPPFVVASKHPNGAVAIAALQRTVNSEIVSLPATVELEIGKGIDRIGIFGAFDSLSLTTDHLPLAQSRIYAQDLAGEEAVDITSGCLRKERHISMPGDLLRKVGTMAQTPGDLSLPGLVIKIRQV